MSLRRWISPVFALLVSLICHSDAKAVCVGGAETCLPAVIDRKSDGVHFSGVIDRDAVDRAAALLKTGDDLFIDSIGGERGAGLRFGRLVFRENIRVIVDSTCDSACALYVFLPARRKILEKLGYVLFHSPMTLWVDIEARDSNAFSVSEKARIITYRRSELALFKMSGVDPEIANCIAKLENPDLNRVYRMNIRMKKLEIPSGGLVYTKKGDFSMVAFSQAALEHFGVKGIEEYWMPVSKSWRQGGWTSEIAWVDGSPGAWCQASPGSDTATDTFP
jgi:hypothetical protein